MKLFQSFKDSLYPAIYLGSFDKCECDCDALYWGLEAQYSLVSHHVDLEFSDESVGTGSVAIEEQWRDAYSF